MAILTEPLTILNAPFIRQAFVGALLAGFLCGIIGPFFVWRRLALFGSAVSHAALTPIAIAQVLRIPFSILLFPFSVVLSLWISNIEQRGVSEADSILSIFFSGLMALGILIMTLSGKGSVDAVHFLFGDILLVSTADIISLGVVSLAIAIYILMNRRELILLLLNPDIAVVEGVQYKQHTYILMALCGLTVACTLSITGIILTTSLLIVPPLVANSFSKNLKAHFVYSILTAIFLSVVGLFISIMIDCPSGPTIAVLGLVVFMGTSVLKQKN